MRAEHVLRGFLKRAQEATFKNDMFEPHPQWPQLPASPTPKLQMSNPTNFAAVHTAPGIPQLGDQSFTPALSKPEGTNQMQSILNRLDFSNGGSAQGGTRQFGGGKDPMFAGVKFKF